VTSAAPRSAGCHTTPRTVARFLCRQALTEYLAERAGVPREDLSRLFDGGAAGISLVPGMAERLRDAVLSCRVCDPAVGGGALLLAMLREMHALLTHLSRLCRNLRGLRQRDDHTLKRHLVAGCLHGADIRPEAVRACRRRLRLEAGGPVPGLSRRIVCGDSLLDLLFDDPRRRAPFDIVVANPPYISFGLRGAGTADRAWAERIRARYPRSAEYKLSTYAVFMDLGLALTRPGGIFASLTPDSYLLGRYFGKLRRRVLDNCAVRALFLIEDDFWKGGVVGRPVIGVFRAGKAPTEEPVLTAARCRTVADLPRGVWESCSYPQSCFEDLRHNRFRLFFAEADRRFVATVERGAGRLGDVISFASGLIGRGGRDSIVADSRRGPTWRPGIDSGADVQPYRVRYRGRFLNFAPEVLKSGFREARYDEPKLLVRQTGDALVAAHDPDGLYCLNNVHVGNATAAGVDVRLVVALLNSALMNRYYRLISLEGGRALAQVDIDVLEDLPFKRPEPRDEREVIALVTRLQGGIAPTAEKEAMQRLERLVCKAYLGLK
jgi:hypothetical protein